MRLPRLLPILASRPSDELVVAQFRAFRKRVQILYAVLAINTIAVAITHYGHTPVMLSVVVPAVLVGMIAFRAWHWTRWRHRKFTADEARDTLKRVTRLAVTLALTMLGWGLLLYPFDDGAGVNRITTHGHIVIYIGLTVICCATLLMHLRRVAMLITLTIIPPFCLFLLLQGSLIETAVALNFALVAVAMLYILNVFARDFQQLVLSKVALGKLHRTQTNLANTDALTGLANRRRFFATLDTVARAGTPHGLLVLDLDGFKQINDLHGHTVGDGVLAEIGRRVSACAHGAACVARLGGDEFAVLLAHDVSPESLVELGCDLILACSVPVTEERHVLTVGASVGAHLVATPLPDSNPVQAYERADYALSHIKQTGKGRVEIFSPAHEQRIRAESELEQALRSADFDIELTVLYQPIVCAADFSVTSFEALARWTSPALGTVSPSAFIPAAEESGLIQTITRTMLARVLRDLERLPIHVGMKINLSARDLASPQQVLQLLSMVRKSLIDPRRLSFEITESSFINDMEGAQAALSLIKASGISIAIDDFGTGYSSLSYIHRIAPDELKIDRSFITALSSQEMARSIVKSIVELSKNIGARCLAEGTETAAEVEILREFGCDEFQGYFFGKPQTLDQCLKLLAGADRITPQLAVAAG